MVPTELITAFSAVTILLTITVNRLNYIYFFVGVVNLEKNVVVRLFPFDTANIWQLSELTKQKMKKSIKCNILSMNYTSYTVDSYILQIHDL